MTGAMGIPMVAVLREPMRAFTSIDQLLLHPLLVVLMLEESLGFVQPEDLSLVGGVRPEPEGSTHAGKRWLALRVRALSEP